MTLKRRTLLTHSFLIALVLIGGGPVDGQTPPPNLPGIAPSAVASSLVSYADASSEPCTTACWDHNNNEVCDKGEHRAWNDDHNSHTGLPHETPRTSLPGDCEGGGHTTACTGSPDLTQFALLHPPNPVEAAALARRDPGSITYNAARKAIQVTACDGRIIAHLPVARGGVLASDQGLP